MLVPDNALISIVIPTFNSAEHLQECLDSIRQQQFQDYEVWVIDGLSTDATVEIVKKNESRFDHLFYISERDNGVYDAMNKGIGASTGKWLYFLGSDDTFIDENVLGSVFDILDDSEIDVLYGNVRLAKTGQVYAGEFGNQKIYEMNISQQAIFYKRRVFDIVGRFELAYKSNADWAHNFLWFFNSSLRKIYLNLTIANYSETGLSSWYLDSVFKKRKELLYLKQAEKYIDENFKARVLKSLAIKRRNSHNYFEFLWYALIYFIKSKSIIGWLELMGMKKSA